MQVNSALAKTNELEVVTESWPPFIISGQDVSGIDTDRVRKILNDTGINYTIKIYPWARSYYLATNKPNVLIYSIHKSKQREPLFHWYCPTHKSTQINAYKIMTLHT